MGYDSVRNLKKEQNTSENKEFHRYIVVGSDPFSLSLFNKLFEKYGSEVKLLAPRNVEPEDCHVYGPNSLRGNLEGLKELSLSPVENKPVFYKEMKFREFNGRSKSEPLLWGESFYTSQSYTAPSEGLFSDIQTDEFLKRANENRLHEVLVDVQRTTRDNLIEDAKWNLRTASGTIFQCEYLLWGQGPSEFLRLYGHKEELSDDYIQFCESVNPRCELSIRLTFDEKLTDEERTLFIPLSYTHEWGHFIGEFKLIGERQIGDFITFIDKDHTTEEDVSRKIKILKKNLKKIFPNFSSVSYEEYIVLNQNPGCSKIDDGLFLKVRNETPNLSFVGYNGVLEFCKDENVNFEDSNGAVSHFARALLVKGQVEAALLS